MDSFIKLLDGETVLFEIEYHSCFYIEKAILTNKRIIEHTINAFCGKDEELYCTFLKDIVEFQYSITPLFFCCGSKCLLKDITIKTFLSTRRINIGETEDLPKLVEIFTQAIENAHKEE